MTDNIKRVRDFTFGYVKTSAHERELPKQNATNDSLLSKILSCAPSIRITYLDRNSSFEELLINDNSISIHQQNLQLLVTEIYRTRMNLNPSFTKQIFVEREIHYGLKVTNNIYARQPKTTAYGLDIISVPGQNL